MDEPSMVDEWAGNCLGTVVPLPQTMSMEEHEKRRREAEVQQAIYVLRRAQEIRRDAALMTEIRDYIRAERDRLGLLLDEVG